MSTAYRQLPAVETLVNATSTRLNGHLPTRDVLVETARIVLGEARRAIADGGTAPPAEQLEELLIARVQAIAQPSLWPVINASGVIIQTNLGRAPLSRTALQAMEAVGAGYSNLEYDLEAGQRGSRHSHLNEILCRLTGAEATLTVNNNAAAVYLVLLALAAGREVIVSRGQAVEIGGGFRIPDVLRASGASLVEVGTTNRTYAHDYQAAITEHTALLMRIHTSNFRLVGFVHETSLADMVEVAQRNSIRVLDDLGSGSLLSTAQYGLAPEPTVQQAIATGADLVTFSGDKLLGGPQAGIIVGRRQLIEALKHHPLARALRLDKTTIAGLEATLQSYLRNRATEEIPVWQMISATPEAIRLRAVGCAAILGSQVEVVPCHSAVGGGSLPGETLPSYGVAVSTDQPDALARALRAGSTPVVGRIHEGRLLLDLRTVLPEQETMFVTAVRETLRDPY